MIDAICIEETDVSEIKVEENGKCAVILNKDRQNHLRIRVDGCVACEGVAADWVIERNQDAVIIELKGRNVEHGANQILSTAHRWKSVEFRCENISGLIIGRQTPGASTSMQLKKQAFAKRFKGPLHVVSANSKFQLDHLMSFRGPFKR